MPCRMAPKHLEIRDTYGSGHTKWTIRGGVRSRNRRRKVTGCNVEVAVMIEIAPKNMRKESAS